MGAESDSGPGWILVYCNVMTWMKFLGVLGDVRLEYSNNLQERSSLSPWAFYG